MQFVKQKQNLVIRNYDSEINTGHRSKRHGQLLPNSIRCIICGPSNCGKTNVMLGLLTEPHGLKFANVYLYSKSLQQPKYLFLQKCLSQVKKLGFFPYDENTDIVKPHEAKPHSIFIFDDVACDKQDCMREFFSMGRHNLVDSFYLCQTYTRIPKHLIRDNTNLIALFKQDDMNLRHIYEDHVNTDMEFATFKELCSTCWRHKYGFVVIDKDSDIGKGRYRNGFDNFLKCDR